MEAAEALIGNTTAQIQIVLAGKFAKMNSDQEKNIATLLEAAAQSSQKALGALQAGTGGNLDISV